MKTVLEGLSKEKLVNILVGLTDEDPVLYNRLLFNFAEADERQEVDRCKTLIDSIVQKYVGRERYITYKYVDDFSDELSNVLERIETLENPLIAIEIAGLLLTEAINSFQYADDSGGRIGFLIDQTLQEMQVIVNAPLEITVQHKLLDKLIHLSKDSVFEGWEDYRIDVLSICSAFAGSETLRRKLMTELESKIDDLTACSTKHYENERLSNLMYTIIQTYGTSEEASQFLRDKVKYASFRERLMQQEMDVGNYDEVIRLAFDGERMDKDYLGLLTGWRKWRYDSYKQLNSPNEQTKLGRELLMEGHFEYYWDLKELAMDDYTAFYNQLKQELEVENRRVYLQLIEAEKDVDAILAYVRENPSQIERYLEYIVDSHKDEAIRLFESHIKTMADAATNRNKYRDVCQVLRRFRKFAGREAEILLLDELKMTYQRRPAFMDELSKL